MQIHEIIRKNPNKKTKTVGRGGKRGKTSGRGHKGQKARAGGTPRPELRDMIKKIPKLRGHGKNRAKTVNTRRVKPSVINVSRLESIFDNGSTVTPEILFVQRLIRKRSGKLPAVKILGTGNISKKLTIVGCDVSPAAKEKIEKAKGVIKN